MTPNTHSNTHSRHLLESPTVKWHFEIDGGNLDFEVILIQMQKLKGNSNRKNENRNEGKTTLEKMDTSSKQNTTKKKQSKHGKSDSGNAIKEWVMPPPSRDLVAVPKTCVTRGTCCNNKSTYVLL